MQLSAGQDSGAIQSAVDLIDSAVEAPNGAQPSPRDLNASTINVTRCTTLRDVPKPDSEELWAQNVCSDHMATVRWTAKGGWETPEIKPFADISISPVASCLHYATQCFEGMKVYRGYDGKLRLFRPDCNAERLVTSSKRIALPAFAPDALVKIIKALLKIDARRWLPADRTGEFLYVRPAHIGTGRQLGVQLPEEALLFVVVVPWPDFSTQSPPGAPPRQPGLKLLASKSDMTRAWPGGFGHAKVGANYGPSFLAHGEAKARGYDQILWLFGPDCQVTEAGASNFFVIMKNAKTGNVELITAPLEDKVILPGVTRRSILELARDRLGGELEVVERTFTMYEIEQACEDGSIVEAFVSGTAFFITPVSTIHFKDRDLSIPMGESGSGCYAVQLKKWLKDIMYGNETHEWGVEVDEE